MPADDLKILLCTQYRPGYVAAPSFSRYQVVAGPETPDEVLPDGRVAMMKTPTGIYDIRGIIDRLPPAQRPDLLIVKADATRRNLPANLSALAIPKVLILGDTQHQKRPIQYMLSYALQERYDLYLSDHKRHHLHYFVEAGLPAVRWLPGLLVQDWGIPFRFDRELSVAFVGQMGARHPIRERLLRFAEARQLPLHAIKVPQREASEIYARSLLTLNQSLNGDLNLRAFEGPLAGACMIMDRLAPQSGLSLLFEAGRHFLAYDGFEEMAALIAHALAHPAEALAIAQAAYLRAHERHAPARNRDALMTMILKGTHDPLHDAHLEKRSGALSSRDFDDLLLRAEQYEYFQARHLAEERLLVLFLPGADERLACDLVDLPRLQVVWGADPAPPLFAAAEVASQIACVAPDRWRSDRLSCLVASSARAAQSGDGDDAVMRLRPEAVLLTDWFREAGLACRPAASERLARHGYRFAGDPADPGDRLGLFVRERP